MKQHRHMGSLMKSITPNCSSAKDGDVLFQVVLVPGVCCLIVPFGYAAGPVAPWINQASNLNFEAIFSDVAGALVFSSNHP